MKYIFVNFRKSKIIKTSKELKELLNKEVSLQGYVKLPMEITEGYYVTCVEENALREMVEGERHGDGYIEGLCFRVGHLSTYDDGVVLWGGRNGNGVYLHDVRPSTKEEIDNLRKK